MTNEQDVQTMGEQAVATAELLATQVDALIRRCAAKDETFATERAMWKRRVAKLERDLKTAKRGAK